MQISTYKDYKKGNEEWMPLIPSHWKLTRFQWIGSFESGKAHEPFVDDDGDYICVNSRFISTHGRVIKRCTKNITPASPGDTLAVMSDLPNGRALARAFYVEHKDIYAVNQRVCRLSPGKEWARFIYWLIDRNPGLLWFDDGFNQTHIPNSGYTKLAIALPPLEEQKSIASFLDQETAKIDDLITEQERLIELLQEKRQAVITHAVTKGLNPNAPMKDSGVEWLREVPEHWEIKPIKHLCLIKRGKFGHRPRNDPDFYDGAYPFIQTGNITSTNKYITEFSQTLNEKGREVSQEFKAGTIAMAIAANVGDSAILNFDCYFPDSIVGLSPNQYTETDFLFYMLKAAKTEIMKAGTQNAQANVNVEQIGAVKSCQPPIQEQREICAEIEKGSQAINDSINMSLKCIHLLHERRSALISAAVTGQIDVRGFISEEVTAA